MNDPHEQKFRAFFEHAPIGLFRSEPAGRLTDANHALAGILGYASVVEMLGAIQELGQLFVESACQAEFMRLLSGPSAIHDFECELRCRDGRAVRASLNACSVRDQDGSVIAREGTVTEIERRKHREARQRQSQRMEAFGQMASGIAHDFNNMLTVINGYSEILLGELPAHEPALVYVREIRQSGERAALLTRQLLAFGRKQILAPVILDLNLLVNHLLPALGRVLGNDIKLDIRLDPVLEQVKADPPQLETVIMNLAANAHDAMPRGGQLLIETTMVELTEPRADVNDELSPGKYVRLAITDTGCGMDQETLAHAFEPFFTTKQIGRGNGLGLATAFGIVKQSDGYMQVASSPGKGTCIQIYLPPVHPA